MQSGINTYWFCICTNNTEVMVLRRAREKPVCSPLPFTNSTQPEGDDALLYSNDPFDVWLCSSDTKITHSPPQNATAALLSGVILPLLISGKRSANENAWTFYLETYFLLALWVWKKGQRVLGEIRFARELSCTKTAVSSICITRCMHTHKASFTSTSHSQCGTVYEGTGWGLVLWIKVSLVNYLNLPISQGGNTVLLKKQLVP